MDAVTPEDEKATGIGQLLPYAWYTRAVAVNVLDELSPASLFEVNGEAVCDVIAGASKVDQSIAERLTSGRHELAGQAYTNAWQKWLEMNQWQYEKNADYSGVLAVSSIKGGSPINSGFEVVFDAISGRALLQQPPAITIDDEGEEKLIPVWSKAAKACLEAAMAVGAPHLSTGSDRQTLTAAWRSALGEGS